MKNLKWLFVLFVAAQNLVHAEPTSPYGYITNIRAYVNGIIYIEHNIGICGFKVFTADTASVGGKAIYAAAMAGYLAQKPVAIEVPTNRLLKNHSPVGNS